MDATAILNTVGELSTHKLHHYLNELQKSGCICKILLKSVSGNIYVYEFISSYGSKVDITSIAMSHPLHQITLATAGRAPIASKLG
jgi:hypothetical protein